MRMGWLGLPACSRDWSWDLRTTDEAGKGKLSLLVCLLDFCLESSWTRVRASLCSFFLTLGWQKKTLEGTSFGALWLLDDSQFLLLLTIDPFLHMGLYYVLFVSFCVLRAWLVFSESVFALRVFICQGVQIVGPACAGSQPSVWGPQEFEVSWTEMQEPAVQLAPYWPLPALGGFICLSLLPC